MQWLKGFVQLWLSWLSADSQGQAFGRQIKKPGIVCYNVKYLLTTEMTTSVGADRRTAEFVNPKIKTSLSVCQVARATGEAKCYGSKLHKEVTEIKVYWFVCLNTFKFAKSKNGLFET